MSVIANDTTATLSLAQSHFRVFSVPELADIILSYLAKRAVLSLRSVCRAFHRAVNPSRWIGGDVTSMTGCFQEADQDPLYEFKRINLRVLGPDKAIFGILGIESVGRALRECPNLTALRLAFSWEQDWTDWKETVIEALKDKVLAVLQSGGAQALTASFADMALSTQSSRTNNHLLQNLVPTIGLKFLYLQFRLQEDTVLSPVNLETALDYLSKHTVEITPDLVPYLEQHSVLSRLVTPATPSSPMSLPILPQLSLLDIAAPHNQKFVLSWDSLIQFMTTAAPNLKELWLDRISVQITGSDLDVKGPVITNLKILGFRCLIGDALAKKVVKTFPQIEELSVYNITPFWHQTDIVSSSAVSRWPMSKSATRARNNSRTKGGEEQEDDEYKWTPFPFLKFLRLRSPNQAIRLETLTDLVPLEEHQVPHCFNDLFLEGGHVGGLQTTLSLRMPSSLRLQRLTILSHADWNPSVDKESDRIWAQFLMKPCCDELRGMSLFHRTTILRDLIADIRNSMTLMEKNAGLLKDDNNPPVAQVEQVELDESPEQEQEQDVEEQDVEEQAILKLYSSEAYLSVLRQSIRVKVNFASHLRSLRLQGYWQRYTASNAFILDVNLFLHCCPRLTDFWMMDGSVTDVDLLFNGLGRCPDISPRLSAASGDPQTAEDGCNENHEESAASGIILDKGLHDVSWINGERPHLQRLQLGLSIPKDNGEIEKSLRARFRHMDMLRLYFQ